MTFSDEAEAIEAVLEADAVIELFLSLFFTSILEAIFEVSELERKEVDIVRVLRAGRVPKVVKLLEAVNCSTVVVSTFSSLMKVTLSLLLDLRLLSSLEAAGLLASSASASFGT